MQYNNENMIFVQKSDYNISRILMQGNLIFCFYHSASILFNFLSIEFTWKQACWIYFRFV